MTDSTTSRNGNRRLNAPVRNRYFYGKLLDVAHLEMEQRYFLESSRRINRLGLGAGVLCGLDVRARDGKVVIRPGVAVDGHGREIVVTERVVIDDPWELTDDCARPTGERLEGGPVVLCLAYHECDVEPAPVLVADCDIREECVPGAVRERFRVLIHDAADVELPGDPCSALRGGVRPPIDRPPVIGPHRPERLTEREDAAAEEREGTSSEEREEASTPSRWPAGGDDLARELHRAGARTELGARPTGLRERLCAALRPSCGPGEDCIPVALVTHSEDGELVVDPCGARRTIYSNAVLLDLILCLAEQMDRCCERRVTTTAPVISAMTPAPASAVKRQELVQALDLDDGGIALGFDREMRQDRLEDPDEWLRVVLLVSAGREAGPEAATHALVPAAGLAAVRVQLELARTEDKLLDGSDGFTAVYRFKGAREGAAAGGVLAALEQLGISSARFLVLARSDHVTQIVDAEDEPELLDADYDGSLLDPYMLDLLWDIGGTVPGLATSLATGIAFPAGQDAPPLPSGNGIEGGVFHTYFDLDL